MKRLLIVAHSPSPNTQRLRDEAVQGARSEEVDGVDVTCLTPFHAGPQDVLGCDALLLGTSENLGYMSGAVKDFFDRCYYPCLEETQGLPFAFWIRAGLDGTGTRRAIESISGGLRWRHVHDPLICHGDWQEEFPVQVRELGLYMSAGLEAAIF